MQFQVAKIAITSDCELPNEANCDLGRAARKVTAFATTEVLHSIRPTRMRRHGTPRKFRSLIGALFV
jgi:hypothetical protein